MNKNWSNTVLVAFSLLPKIVKELDFAFEARLNTAFGSVHLKNGVSNERLMNEMIEINSRKAKLVNLKVLVECVLAELDAADRRCLTMRVIDKLTFQEIAEMERVSLRTVFRRFDRAQKAFENVMRRKGYSAERLESEYGAIDSVKALKERFAADTYFIAKSQ